MPTAAEETNGVTASLLARLNKLEADIAAKDKALLEAQAAANPSSVAGSSVEHGAAPAAAGAPGREPKRARSS